MALQWSKKAGADGYYIYRYDTKSKKTTKVATIKGNKTTGTVSKLKANTAYTFQVAAYTTDSSTKTGAKSSKVSTKTLTATPKISSATSPKSKKITIKWGKVACSGYQVQYSTTKNFLHLPAQDHLLCAYPFLPHRGQEKSLLRLERHQVR